MKQYKDTDYYITECGKVYNKKYERYVKIVEKEHKRSTHKRAYVGLSIDKKQKWFTLARLVAELYIPNSNNYSQVNHIDGNPLNNHKDNLEWCTQSQNIKHAINTGLKKMKGENNHSAKLTKELVNLIREEYSKNSISLRALAVKYNVSYTTIRYAINGKTWN